MNPKLKKFTTAVFIAFVLMFAFFSAMAQGGQQTLQTTPTATAPVNLDAEMAAAKTQIAVLAIQQDIEALTTQEKTLEKQQAAAAPALTTDAAMVAAQAKVKILEIKQKIAELKAQQAALLNPPAPVIPTVPAPAVPAVAPVNCVPSNGPNVTVHAPPKASKWACEHLGVCVDNKAIPVPTSSACPAGMTPATGTNQK